MYPFGAPAVKCSLCLFVTEIGKKNSTNCLCMHLCASSFNKHATIP
uniref:Zinc finger LSD1-type domain-containing protein n=1 Tax=Aegilops tauschii subsp. strangulata TaxID=200361 RepID=A0A453F1J4_AEGTS